MTEEELVASFPCETRVIEYNGKLVAVVGLDKPKYRGQVNSYYGPSYYTKLSSRGIWVAMGATHWLPVHDLRGWINALEEASRQLFGES